MFCPEREVRDLPRPATARADDEDLWHTAAFAWNTIRPPAGRPVPAPADPASAGAKQPTATNADTEQRNDDVSFIVTSEPTSRSSRSTGPFRPRQS